MHTRHKWADTRRNVGQFIASGLRIPKKIVDLSYPPKLLEAMAKKVCFVLRSLLSNCQGSWSCNGWKFKNKLRLLNKENENVPWKGNKFLESHVTKKITETSSNSDPSPTYNTATTKREREKEEGLQVIYPNTAISTSIHSTLQVR